MDSIDIGHVPRPANEERYTNLVSAIEILQSHRIKYFDELDGTPWLFLYHAGEYLKKQRDAEIAYIFDDPDRHPSVKRLY